MPREDINFEPLNLSLDNPIHDIMKSIHFGCYTGEYFPIYANSLSFRGFKRNVFMTLWNNPVEKLRMAEHQMLQILYLYRSMLCIIVLAY